jgi:hypothetical protein
MGQNLCHLFVFLSWRTLVLSLIYRFIVGGHTFSQWRLHFYRFGVHWFYRLFIALSSGVTLLASGGCISIGLAYTGFIAYLSFYHLVETLFASGGCISLGLAYTGFIAYLSLIYRLFIALSSGW